MDSENLATVKNYSLRTVFKKHNRSSNLEILRIISIIMIIMHHYAIYSGFEFENTITVNKVIINF